MRADCDLILGPVQIPEDDVSLAKQEDVADPALVQPECFRRRLPPVDLLHPAKPAQKLEGPLHVGLIGQIHVAGATQVAVVHDVAIPDNGYSLAPDPVLGDHSPDVDRLALRRHPVIRREVHLETGVVVQDAAQVLV